MLAALGPKMLELAGRKADGAHPLSVTPEHTARAREIMGPDKRLYVEQKVALTTDALTARGLAREALEYYLTLPNYVNNWLSLGFTADEIATAADRFLDGIVVWGDENAIRQRIEAHYRAGADHVCINILGDLPTTLKALAPG